MNTSTKQNELFELMNKEIVMKKKAYMVCDYTDEKASSMQGAPNIGVEFMGNCAGRIVDENNNLLGQHHSSSFGWLRSDLSRKVNPEEYEIVDLIGKEIPEHLKKNIG
jgi:hypothetical protein